MHERIEKFTLATTICENVLDLFHEQGVHDILSETPSQTFNSETIRTSFIHRIHCQQAGWNIAIGLNFRSGLAHPHVNIRFQYPRKKAGFYLTCSFDTSMVPERQACFVCTEEQSCEALFRARDLLHMNFSSLNNRDLQAGFSLERFMVFARDLAINTGTRSAQARKYRRRSKGDPSIRHRPATSPDVDPSHLFDG